MRAIQLTEFGGPDVLEFEEVPDPAADGNVLVKVEAAGINHFDITQRTAPEILRFARVAAADLARRTKSLSRMSGRKLTTMCT